MTQTNFVPDVARIQKAIAESRETRKALEIVSLELDELLLDLEKRNIQQRLSLRKKHLKA